jgi:hypothetical protein
MYSRTLLSQWELVALRVGRSVLHWMPIDQANVLLGRRQPVIAPTSCNNKNTFMLASAGKEVLSFRRKLSETFACCVIIGQLRHHRTLLDRTVARTTVLLLVRKIERAL